MSVSEKMKQGLDKIWHTWDEDISLETFNVWTMCTTEISLLNAQFLINLKKFKIIIIIKSIIINQFTIHNYKKLPEKQIYINHP